MGKVGRPKKYTIKNLVESGRWSPDWKKEILELGREGKSRVHIRNHFNMNKNSYHELYDCDMEFRETINKAMELSQQWWIDIAQKRWIEGTEKNINSNHWSLIMRNMFKEEWSDRKEMDVTSEGEKLNGGNDIIVKIISPEKEDGVQDK